MFQLHSMHITFYSLHEYNNMESKFLIAKQVGDLENSI